MNFSTFLIYYFVVDAVLSLTVFGVLYYFRSTLLDRLRIVLRNFLGLNEQVDEVEENEDFYDDEVYSEEEEGEVLKPAMRQALDKEFDL